MMDSNDMSPHTVDGCFQRSGSSTLDLGATKPKIAFWLTSKSPCIDHTLNAPIRIVFAVREPREPSNHHNLLNHVVLANLLVSLISVRVYVT